MNYQERVQALAEKMAKTFYTDFEDRNEIQKDLYIAWCTPHSRIAVAEMAEVYIMANMPHYHMNEMLLASGMDRINIEMKEHGLIPSAQEGGSDGKE